MPGGSSAKKNRPFTSVSTDRIPIRFSDDTVMSTAGIGSPPSSTTTPFTVPDVTEPNAAVGAMMATIKINFSSETSRGMALPLCSPEKGRGAPLGRGSTIRDSMGLWCCRVDSQENDVPVCKTSSQRAVHLCLPRSSSPRRIAADRASDLPHETSTSRELSPRYCEALPLVLRPDMTPCRGYTLWCTPRTTHWSDP